MTPKEQKHHRRGFTLAELMVAVTVLAIALVSLYSLSRQLSLLGLSAQLKVTAIGIAQAQIELVRNLPYDSVASDVTFPTGPLQANQTINRNGRTFTVETVINEVDDPADGNLQGTIVGKPVDTAWVDYKQVEIRVCWDSSSCNRPVRISTYVAPKNLENSSNTGALFITVIDADGQPVPQADIAVTNSVVNPNVSIINRTDNNGKLQLLSLPPAADSYHISVTKAGYSSDGTLAPTGANPNPVHPDTSIVVASVTSTTFVIDLVSQLSIQVADSQTCSPESAIEIRLRGSRLIGTSPDVYAFNQTYTSNGSGNITITDVPWDTYGLSMETANRDVAGVNPPDTVVVNPGTSVSASMVVAAHQSPTVRFIVRDSGTLSPLANAQVTLDDGGGFSQTLTTDQGTIEQSSWVGGGGQATMTDPTRYATASGGATGQQAGHLRLEQQAITPSVSEDFSTTTHRDGTATTAVWATPVTLPLDLITPTIFQPSALAQSTTLNTQSGVIHEATLRVASSLNGQTITYALTADGVHFETVTPSLTHTFAYPGTDLRWQATLTTTDSSVTPELSQIDIDYTQDVLTDTNGTLTSSTYDNGQATNFLTLSWNASVPPSAGADPVQFQVATNDDASTWNYVGPDGTSGTYFTTSGGSLPASLSGHRYIRYKVYLSTADPLVTPDVTRVTIIKNNSCTPPGQVFFSPLPQSGDYTVTATLSGYQNQSRSINITTNAVEYIDLSP